MTARDLEEYRKSVSEKLRALTPVFAKASIGDFSDNVELPDEEDEFTELYVGVQVMLEVIRDHLSELRELNQSLEEKANAKAAALAEAQHLAHLGSWEWDLATGMMVWSDELFRLFGLPRHDEQISVEEFFQRAHPDDRGMVDNVLSTAIRHHEPFEFDYRIVWPDESVHWLHGQAEIILDVRGSAVRVVGTAQDIDERKYASAILEKSRELYRHLVENANDIIYSVDTDGRITFCNPTAMHILKYSSDEILGKNYLDFVTPEYRDTVARFFKIQFAKHIPNTYFEAPALTKDGHEIWLGQSVHLLSQYNQIESFQVVSRDITQRKKAQEALRKSEARFRSVWENSLDGMRLTDSEGTIVAVNDAFCKLVGMEASSLIGKPLTATYSGAYDTGEMLQKYRERFRARDIDVHTEHSAILGSGKLVCLEVTNSFVELEQHHASLLGIFRDVTERKSAEEQLQILGHTIQSMNDCVVITDLKNIIMFTNPAFQTTYGYTESEIVGINIDALRSQHNPANTNEHIASSTRGTGYHGEILNVRKGGEEFPISLSTSVIRDKQGNPIALAGISRDISDQKRLQGQLEEIARQRTEDLQRFALSVQQAQEEERRRIARELHDDLGQQLSGLKFNIEIFEDTVPGSNKKVAGKLRHIKQQIDNMITAIRRISAALHPSALDDFGLRIALQLLCKDFEKVHQIKVTFQPKDQTRERIAPNIEIALYRIAQEALANIAKHAAASSVSVLLTPYDHVLQFVIRDDGRGFDPDKTRGRKLANRGLGLISMRERAEHLGGTCRITSGTDSGTTILVEVPV